MSDETFSPGQCPVLEKRENGKMVITLVDKGPPGAPGPQGEKGDPGDGAEYAALHGILKATGTDVVPAVPGVDYTDPAKKPLVTTGSYPDRSKTYDQVVAEMGVVYDYKFGTAAAPGKIKMGSNAEMNTHFQGWQNQTNPVVINKEMQRYPKLFGDKPQSMVFNSNNVELRTYIESGGPTLFTKSPVANVNYSRQVTVADASDVKIGQVVGFGNETYDNYHMIYTFSITTPGVGDVYSNTIGHRGLAAGGYFDPITINSFASAGNDANALAQDIVDKINANATFQQYKITAYKMPGVPGGYAFTWPRWSVTDPNEFGSVSKGSLSWLSNTTSRTGTGTYLAPQRLYGATYVVAKTGNVLTLSNPVTLTTASVITFNPSYMMEVAATGGQTVFTHADVSSLKVGQVGNHSYQDNNLRRITAIDVGSGTYTMEASLFMQAGHFNTFFDMFKAVTTTSVIAGDTLTFAAGATAGIRVGMIYMDYFATPGMNNDQNAIVTEVTSTTVKLSIPVTCGSGTNCIFHPYIISGQFWSKWNMLPGPRDNRHVIAMEMTCKTPDASKIGSWPAWWLFTDSTDTNPILGAIAAFGEIDMFDKFTYFNNGSTNIGLMNTPANAVTIEQDANASGNGLNGNNFGLKTRKIGIVWTMEKVYFYIDGILRFAKKVTFPQYKGANMGVDLAFVSLGTGFNSNGFVNLDYSQFPYAFAIEEIKIQATPNSTPPL